MISVQLVSVTPDPLRTLYCAFRVAYSAQPPEQIYRRIDSEKISRDQMLEFVEKRLATGHTSPLEQIQFIFTISGVTRAFSHQFVRTRVGQSPEQQSLRYVTLKNGKFGYTIPQSVVQAGYQDRFVALMDEISAVYADFTEHGIPAEDARSVLPHATHTNFQVAMNFQTIAHVCELRLCTRAQTEYRKVASLIRAEVMKVAPFLGKRLGIKCQAQRLGYCDEDFSSWQACAVGGDRPRESPGRPHKSQIIPADLAIHRQKPSLLEEI